MVRGPRRRPAAARRAAPQRRPSRATRSRLGQSDPHAAYNAAQDNLDQAAGQTRNTPRARPTTTAPTPTPTPPRNPRRSATWNHSPRPPHTLPAPPMAPVHRSQVSGHYLHQSLPGPQLSTPRCTTINDKQHHSLHHQSRSPSARGYHVMSKPTGKTKVLMLKPGAERDYIDAMIRDGESSAQAPPDCIPPTGCATPRARCAAP